MADRQQRYKHIEAVPMRLQSVCMDSKEVSEWDHQEEGEWQFLTMRPFQKEIDGLR